MFNTYEWWFFNVLTRVLFLYVKHVWDMCLTHVDISPEYQIQLSIQVCVLCTAVFAFINDDVMFISKECILITECYYSF